jgi:hypothetical protein
MSQGRPPPPLEPRMMNEPRPDTHSQNYFARNHRNGKLPDPVELASRLEEAKTSASVLHEVLTNTPPSEVLNNDLIKEFADRCTSASRSIELYMRAEDPAPDNDTMESLIDTNEQLQASLSLHQRAILNARKQAGIGRPTDDTSSVLPPPSQTATTSSSRQPSPHRTSQDALGHDVPPIPPRKPNGKGKEREYEYDSTVAGPSAGPSRSHTPAIASAGEDPFRDPYRDEGVASGSGARTRLEDEPPRLGYEPYHPGFNPTSSYIGRQESAVGKEAMHGAFATNEARPSHGVEEEELYDVTPTSKQPPMYRY